MWYVYGLVCKDESLYIGSTNNLRRRLLEHNEGKSRGIRGRGPASAGSAASVGGGTALAVGLHVGVKSEAQARGLEKYFKTGSGKAIVKKRILADEIQM